MSDAPPLIHPTAVVAQGAQLGAGVHLGPYAVVGQGVTLGDRVRLDAHAVVDGRVTIGADTRLHPGCVVGEPPQDLGYRNEPTTVEIGVRNVLREHVTVNAGTLKGRGRTVIGDDNFLMVGVHVGHDCVVGNSTVLSNNVLLAGHATLGDQVLIGGGAAIVQRVRVGSHAFISGLSGVTKDVIPYGYVIGHRGRLDSLNLVGLKRRGFSRQAITTLLSAYKLLFASEGYFADRLARLEAAHGADEVVKPILAFIHEARNRPLLQPLPVEANADADFLESGR